MATFFERPFLEEGRGSQCVVECEVSSTPILPVAQVVDDDAADEVQVGDHR